ncbi:MAG: glycosyltransferase family 2 protein [Chloroflexi bacterium]|nr:glycosyltransferase family 2 protein [Chloroflexota bacterium]
MRLSAVVLARDNESQIADCLQSVAWADERVVILDTRSSDRTAAIAEGLGARVVRHPFANFGAQRNVGLEQALGEWVFFIDTDEQASPALGEEIRHVVAADGAEAGWWVPRHNCIWGSVVRHGGWYPDYQLRLIRRADARYDSAQAVHEVVQVAGEHGYLREVLDHDNYATLAQFTAKQRQYAAYEGQIRFEQGARPRPWTWLSMPAREFVRRYIRLQGYRDGWRGLALAILCAYYYGYVATRVLADNVRKASKAAA